MNQEDDPGLMAQNFVNFVEGGVIPPHIQLQMAQEQFNLQNPDAFAELIQQQGGNPQDFNNQGYVIGGPPQIPIMFNQQQVLLEDLQQQDPPGDDNNNDRPDDVNNNTTDPNLRQQQQLILEHRLQQQQEELEQLENVLGDQGVQEVNDEEVDVKYDVGEDTPGEVGGQEDVEIITNGNTGKKDKRKKKKKKKKNRFFPTDIVKEETDVINNGNENIKPDPEVEIE